VSDQAQAAPARDVAGFGDDWRRLRGLARPGRARDFVLEVVSKLTENNLLTYASAISFQVLFALVPFALVGLALLGFLGLSDFWQDEITPLVRDRVSEPAFTVIQSTVTKILATGQGFWLTFGLALAIWEVSGALRAVTGALNRVYEIEDARSFRRRMVTSIVLAVVVSVLLGGALALVQLGDNAASAIAGGTAARVLGFVVRWVLAIALMLLVVGLVIRYAPAKRGTSPWLGFGAVLVVVSWIVASLVFGWYVTSVASYESVYGSLAVVIVLLTYVYLSAVTFLVGVQVDATLRRVASGRPAGPGS
jgi:membrane protein